MNTRRSAYLSHRLQLINKIMANELNVLTFDELNAWETDILEGTAAIAVPTPQTAEPDVPWFNGKPRFGGLPNGTNRTT